MTHYYLFYQNVEFSNSFKNLFSISVKLVLFKFYYKQSLKFDVMFSNSIKIMFVLYKCYY